MSRSMDLPISFPAFDGTQNCVGIETEMFYSEKGTDTRTKQGQMLREICGACSYQPDCLNYAIKHELHGFWGGSTAADRRIIRKKRGISLITNGFE